jgi:hypothetical protein
MGNNRIAFYRGLSVDLLPQQGQTARGTRLEAFFGDLATRLGQQDPPRAICALKGTNRDDPNCLAGETAQGLDALVSLISALEPQYVIYTKDVAASRKWLEQRRASNKPIADAARSWAAEHSKFVKKLEECGGSRAWRQGCGNLTFANLKLSVGRLRAIAGRGAD